MTLVSDLNSRICAFVNSEGNVHLRPGTGSYSTHFRGMLFGERLASRVEEHLTAGRRAEALFLGSNPNCPPSLESIKGERIASDWAEFQRQAESDEFAEVSFDRAGDCCRWDPLHDPSSLGAGQKAWTFYADCLRESVVDFEAVAMANVLPWGSNNVDALIRAIQEKDPELPSRMLNFANDQLKLIISRLRPRVIICPKSIGDKSWASSLCVSMSRVSNRTSIGPTEISGRRHLLYRGSLPGVAGCTPVVFIDHPSALRFTQTADRPRIADALKDAIRYAFAEMAS